MLNLIHSYPRYLKWKRKDSPNTGKEAQKSAKAAEDDSPKTRKDTVGDDDCAGGSLSPEPIWPTGLTSDPQMDDALVRPKTMEQLTSESSPSTRPNLASSPDLDELRAGTPGVYQDYASGLLASAKDAATPTTMAYQVARRLSEIKHVVDARTVSSLAVVGPDDRNAWQARTHDPEQASSVSPFLAHYEKTRSLPAGQVYAGATEYAARCGKQLAFLQPYLGVGLYNSHGRFFTQNRVMLAVSKHLADNELMGIGDHFIDFSAGSNEFAPMLASATGCTFQSFDLFPPKVRENFVQKNWFSVSSHDVCVEMKDKEIVLGLNPPFGLNNQQSKKFVTHGIQNFQPRLLVLIVPFLGNLKALQGYEIIHHDPDLVKGEDFFIPGTINAHFKTNTRPAFVIYRRVAPRVARMPCIAAATRVHVRGTVCHVA